MIKKMINQNYKEVVAKPKLQQCSNESNYWFLDEEQDKRERQLYDRDMFEGHPDDFGSQ